MTAAPAATDQPGGWRRVFLALMAFAAVSAWPLLGWYAPIADWSLLLVSVIAVCAVIGWARGGRWQSAALWSLGAIALLLLREPAANGDAFRFIERGWILLLAGTFGLSAIVAASHPFFVRALASVAASLAVVLFIASASRGSFERIQGTYSGELITRNQRYIAQWNGIEERLLPTATDSVSLSEGFAGYIELVRVFPQISLLVAPALLALQSVAALALGWVMYHRLSRTRLGTPMSRLREFRFNDQLVWGLAVGLTILLLPAFEEARVVGLNLVLFFGALYFIRGLGVLAWATKGAAFVALAIVLSIFPPMLLLGAVGLSDTWIDWRSRAKAA